MIAINENLLKSKKITGNIIPVHSDAVTGVHEHFCANEKFITVSIDGSLAVTNAETLEIVKFEHLSKSGILASEMVLVKNCKRLLLGNQKGEILEIDQKYSTKRILKSKRLEVTAICDLGDESAVIVHGDDEHGSKVQYVSLTDGKVVNEISLQPGRKIKQMHKIQGVKDKCVVACASCNIYWFKVVDGFLKLLIDQPSPDDYYYDEIWSDGKSLIKAGEPCFMRQDLPEAIKDMLVEERKATRGKANSMFVSDGVIIRSNTSCFKILDMDGTTINKLPLPKNLFPMKIKMHPYGRILMGFQTGEIGRFDFRSQSMRFIMD